MAENKNKNKYDFLIKLLLIGDSGVGKSSLLARFSDNVFSTTFITTIGIDFKIKTIELDGKIVKIQIWDTAGQERFRSITSAYYRGSHGIILVYDATDDHSFSNIQNWNKNIDNNITTDVARLLVGNKYDLDGQVVVEKERGQQVADDYNIKFYPTSAKNGTNVDEAFCEIARQIVKKMAGGSITKPTPPIVIVDPNSLSSRIESCCKN